jgi:hypothetical protein
MPHNDREELIYLPPIRPFKVASDETHILQVAQAGIERLEAANQGRSRFDEH